MVTQMAGLHRWASVCRAASVRCFLVRAVFFHHWRVGPARELLAWARPLSSGLIERFGSPPDVDRAVHPSGDVLPACGHNERPGGGSIAQRCHRSEQMLVGDRIEQSVDQQQSRLAGHGPASINRRS